MSRTVTTLELPWPPSINHYWRRVGPRVLIAKKGREYTELVKQATVGVVCGLKGRMAITIRAIRPDRRERDLDNVWKAVLDSLVRGGVIPDDSIKYVWRECIEDAGVAPDGNGRLLLEIEE